MSLIDEALKRAQEEAARRDAVEKGVPSPWTTTLPPGRRRSLPLILALSAAGLAAGLIASFFLLRPANRPAPAPRVPGRSVPAVSAAPVPPASASASAAAGSDRETASRVPAHAPPAKALSPRPVSAEPRAAESAPMHPPAGKERPRALEDGRTYVREVPLPGGDKIELDGIVFSDTSPAAMVNGRVVASGSLVGDFTVGAIEAERVELKGQGVTIWVALK